MINLLLETHLEPEQRFFATTVHESAESLLRVINDILDFSKIEAGRLEVERENFALLDVLQGSVLVVAEPAAKKNLELVCDFDPQLPLEVEGDATRLRQVLTNLIGNAVKFTEAGEVVVKAQVECATERQANIRISVEDTGCGIPEQAQETLFRPFQQADGTMTRKHGGTGLGLAISKRLVELMGGYIGFRSRVGQGSNFWISLPFRIQREAAPSPEVTAGRVLLVEPHLRSRLALQTQLRHAGFSCEAASSLSEARSLLGEEPDVPVTHLLVTVREQQEEFAYLAVEAIRSGAVGADRVVALCPFGSRPPEAYLQACGTDSFLYRPAWMREITRLLRRGEATTMAEAVAPPMRRASGSSLRVLIVEDIPTNQKVIQLLLRSLGHQFETAGNGREALERLREAAFDVVLMDCQMPEMDGYEATRLVRSGRCGGAVANIPIVAMTAHAMRGDDLSCYEAGMNHYLTKPLHKQEVAGVLQRYQVEANFEARNSGAA